MLSRLDVKFFKLAVGVDNLGKESDVDVVARCPVCGDSRTHKNKKRLHLYIKNNVTNVNCFNGDCSVHNKTMYSFLRDFYPNLLPQYKRENFNTTIESLANGDVFKNVSVEKEKADIDTFDLSPFMNDIETSQDALNYLQRRGYNYNGEFGKWYFGYQDLIIDETRYSIKDSIVIPLYYHDEMYGFYSRKIHEKMFYTYMKDTNIGYKIWNWFGVNKNEPVYIFEGIFDAISSGLKNSISALGAKIPDERIKELKHPVFVLDNDKTGLKNSLEYARRGYNVYVQPNDLEEKDMNELYMNHKDLNVSSIIQDNLFAGISAEVRIKAKL